MGDESFQRKCERRIAERIEAGATLVLVSHDASLIERTCERTVVLDAGEAVFDGPTGEAMPFYHRLMGTEVVMSAAVTADVDLKQRRPDGGKG